MSASQKRYGFAIISEVGSLPFPSQSFQVRVPSKVSPELGVAYRFMDGSDSALPGGRRLTRLHCFIPHRFRFRHKGPRM